MAQASAEKLKHTEPGEKERVASAPQSERLARIPELSLPNGKGTESSVQITILSNRREMSESRTLAGKRGME